MSHNFLKEGKAQSGIELEVLGDEGKVYTRQDRWRWPWCSTDYQPMRVCCWLSAAMKSQWWRCKSRSLDLAEFDIGGHLPRDAKLFAWSGRDLYRPGEKFVASLLAS